MAAASVTTDAVSKVLEIFAKQTKIPKAQRETHLLGSPTLEVVKA